jgi:hypothetical protein
MAPWKSSWVTEQMKTVVPMKVRREAQRTRVEARRFTSHLRTLPNVLIIGAQRCGTSSLYKYLGQHPEARASIRKEVGFFTAYVHKGEGWYRAHFPLTCTPLHRRTKVYFEASPDYMLDPRCAERAARTLTEGRIIVLLRDPVGRAFSHYQHNVRLGQEPHSFEEALDLEESRLAPHREAMEREPHVSMPTRDFKRFLRFSYVTRGLYAEQLEPWLKHFPRDRVLVQSSEELFREPTRVFSIITSFLDLSSWIPPEFKNHSYSTSGSQARPVGAVAPSTRGQLEERFREPNRRLHSLLGRSMWR